MHAPPDDGLDTLFDTLSNLRRRFVIERLEDADEMALGDLADDLATVERDDRQNCYIALYQVHLPKLDDRDVVDWDKRAGIVQPGADYQDHLAAYRAVVDAVDGDSPNALLDRVGSLFG